MPPQGPGESSKRWGISILVVGLILLLLLGPSLLHTTSSKTQTYNTFYKSLIDNKLSAVQVNNASGGITYTYKGKAASYVTTGPISLPQSEVTALQEHGTKVTYVTPTSSIWPSIIEWVIFLAIGFLLLTFFMRRAQGQMSGLMSIGRSRAKIYSTERPGTTFADVAGYEGVKQEISEVVDFLKSPARFKAIGAKTPKGFLLVGPPGTGKTLLARAVAGEAGVPFMSVTGSDFMEMLVGVGASRVRDLFQMARKQAPAIIFIDEIDSIGRKRGAGLGLSGGHDEREQTLNQMLAEMDGFDPSEGIVVIGATNRPEILDPALLRPGRFDRQMVVPLPDLKERKPILEVHCRDKKIGPDVDLEIIARGTPGMSGADLANLVNEAALHAVRRGSQMIEMQDFDEARDRVLMGQKRDSMALSETEKERIAYHESGHAVLAYILPSADPLLKVSIIPAGMALGVTQQLPLEEKHIYKRDYIEDSLTVRMGGRVAELMIYGDLSTGASDDLQRNTDLALKMVREWGMSDTIGPVAWGSQGSVMLGDEIMPQRDYSEEMSRIVDEEVAKILRKAESQAREKLEEHREGLMRVAKELLEKETVDGSEVARLIDEAYGKPVHGDTPDVPHFAGSIVEAGKYQKEDI